MALIEPQLAVAKPYFPSGSEWIYEPKLDGYRAMVFKTNNEVRIITRNGFNWTERYQILHDELKAIRGDFILDGEIVFLDDNGIPNFNKLQTAMAKRQTHRLIFYAFDILRIGFKELKSLPQIQRKDHLEKFFKTSKSNLIRRCEHFVSDDSKELYEAFLEAGFEGMVCKLAKESYISGKSSNWVKKVGRTRESFWVIGVLRSERGGISELLLAEKSGKQFRFKGSVSPRLERKEYFLLKEIVSDLSTESSPKGIIPNPNCTYLIPEIIVDVEYLQWTPERLFRQPVFKGFRLDLMAKTSSLLKAV